jgi:hypothetical protein
MRATTTSCFVFPLALLAHLLSGAIQLSAQNLPKNGRPGMRNGDTVPVGATGFTVQANKQREVSVREVQSGTPAFGKLEPGVLIVGVNGTPLDASDPWPVLGSALTRAEASDGILNFDIRKNAASAPGKVQIKIPVLGRYAETFPLKCPKTDAIVDRAAAFYAGKDRLRGHNHLNGVVCLFLLSTGDEKLVPRVKEYFAQFLKADGTVAGIGDMNWDNGYNGVACAEYYLRTGDASVLPILQYYCDNAKHRLLYDSGWNHWGNTVNPLYEAGGGLMNPAGNQILLTLVLGKMCGVDVDDPTLTKSLRYFYRFIGHGIFPIADQRAWQSFGSVDRAGASAAVMHVAGFAKSDTTIYRQAKDYLTLFNLTSWPGNLWDVIWYDLSASYRLDADPQAYHQAQQDYQWAYDLYRQPAGNFRYPPGHASLNEIDAGAAVALALTSARRKLCITGAPRSPHAREFSLPERLWGNDADLAFLSPRHHQDFAKFGKEESTLVAYSRLPYAKSVDVKKLEPDLLLEFVLHARCEIRTAAAKALCRNKQWAAIEALLFDPDPRFRRAALDGINDYTPWFFNPPVGKFAIPAADFTPAMQNAITSILHNPKEAWYVLDGAMMALGHAPVPLIEKNVPRVLPWTKHEDWWMRDAAFQALIGLKSDQRLFVQHVPTLLEMLAKELHVNPHARMNNQLKLALKECGPDSAAGRLIAAGWIRSGVENTIPEDTGKVKHSIAGMANSIEVFQAVIESSPESAADLAEAIATSGRLETFDDASLVKILKDKDEKVQDRYVGLYPMLEKLPARDRERLAATLYDHFRPEMIKRVKARKGAPEAAMLDMMVDLTRIRSNVAGWQPIGTPSPAKLVWKYLSFDPESLGAKVVAPRGAQSLCEITYPDAMKSWYAPEFDDSRWKSGRAPIGVGVFKAHGHGRAWTATPDFSFKNQSAWGEGGFLNARAKFEVADSGFDYYRISVLGDQGYHIYLNGQKIHTFAWFAAFPQYAKTVLDPKQAGLIRKGTNTLAVHTVVRHEKDPKSNGKADTVGQIDLFIEGLKKQEIGL